MIFKPFHYFDSGFASYVFGCGTLGLCAVVDPQERDTDAYIAFADAKEMRITHIIDTHLHADHRSGGRALASRTGASYCLHYSADVDFPFEPLDDGQTIELGNTIVHVLHTPGHTLEMVFGIVKALTNYFAGRLSDAVGRKTVPVAGWLIAVPVPFLLMWAPSWNWILAANALLGVSQGLTWSTTVIMKIDLAGPERRGLAMG